MGPLQSEALHAYKAVIKAMVRSNKKSKIALRLGEKKQEIAVLTYKRMNVVREMNVKNIDVLRKSRLVRDLQSLNRKVETLKNSDPSRDRKLHFIEDSGSIKKEFLSHALNERNIIHFKDVASFLTNQREYDELIERYNPGTKLSQEEIVKRTAERVGLNVPFQ
ncbi:hypothetical protein HG535_0D02130 [Zygotorulaspora mrakii]|uniref:Uncharacterized protein n=1 Tax=Zygotorulaspora mrakii TaxID=42260 RepID=A0A7H9B1G5_ZYGMR|nr:uncharacterized protein HG535_0D02130 [Zygotorulaspora mrakii]QLG72505.1 hypothetical protein HG535_0D02130 [Zygotorulaspora mrakii]